jgi:hypothetical protein
VRGKPGIGLVDLSGYQEVAWIPWKLQDVVNEKEALGRAAIFRKHRGHASLTFTAKDEDRGTAVGIAEVEINLVLMARNYSIDLASEAVDETIKKREHKRLYRTFVTTLAAPWMSAYKGAGTQNPITTTMQAKPRREYFFHAQFSE